MEKYAELENLVKIFGPTGYEKLIQEHYSTIMKPHVDKIYSDVLRNCYADISGDSKLPKVMMNAHADSVGFLVKHIEDRGFVFVMDITGSPAVDYRMLPGTSVVIHGRHKNEMIRGQFIPQKPLHHVQGWEMEESEEREHLLIDVGVKSKAFTEMGLKAVRKHIDIGDYVAMEPNPRYHQLNENHFVSANLDDRVGLYCLYRIAKEISELKLKRKAPISFVSTVREEDWTGAAEVAANRVSPRYSITFDVAVAADTMRGNNEDYIIQKFGEIALDSGIALPRGHGIDDDLFLYMERLCLGKINPKVRIKRQVEIEDAGICENLQIISSKLGVKAGCVGIPCRNTHTTIETISLPDVERAIKLGVEFYKQVSSGNFKL